MRPLVGASRRRTANTITSMMATQNQGRDMPVMASRRKALSIARRRVTAAMTPMTMPATVLNTMATSASSMVGGTRSKSRRLIGAPELMDMPVSPDSKARMKFRYCRWSGLSRSHSASIRAMATGSTSWLLMDWMGLPGTRRRAKKVRVVTVQRTKGSQSRRRTSQASMDHLDWLRM